MKFYTKIIRVIDILERYAPVAESFFPFEFFFLLQTLTASGEVCIWDIEDGLCASRIYLKIPVSMPYK